MIEVRHVAPRRSMGGIVSEERKGGVAAAADLHVATNVSRSLVSRRVVAAETALLLVDSAQSILIIHE